MSYFDYLKNTSYNVIKKNIKLIDINIDNNIHYKYTFEKPINLIKINIPKMYKNCLIYFGNFDGFLLDLCTLEYINNNNFYRCTLYIEIVKKPINYSNSKFNNIENIQIEYTYESLKNITEIKDITSTTDKINNLDKAFVIIDKQINNYIFIHKYHDVYTDRYLYQIDLESFKRENGEGSYILSEYNTIYLNTIKTHLLE